MKTLQLHALKFKYKPIKKALKKEVEEPTYTEFEVKNALVVFTTVEENDDAFIVDKAVNDIIEHAKLVNVKNIVIYPYAHLSPKLAKPDKAVKILRLLEEMLLKKNFNVHRAVFGWYKEFEIHVAGHPLSELSRSYGVEEKIIIEFNRAFSNKLFNEYMGRFGLEIIDKTILFTNKWATSTIKLADYLETRCSDVEIHALTKNIECIKKYSKACIKTIVGARPIGLSYIDTLLPVNKYVLLNKLKKMFRVGRIKEVNGELLYESENVKSILGFICNEEEATALLNTILLTLISSELEALNKGLLPLLPIKLHPTPVYIAITGNVAKSYIDKVCSEVNEANLEYDIDNSTKRLGEKLRKAGMLWTPIILIVGAREEETNTVVLRERHTGKQYICSINELSGTLKKVIDSYEKYRETTRAHT